MTGWRVLTYYIITVSLEQGVYHVYTLTYTATINKHSSCLYYKWADTAFPVYSSITSLTGSVMAVQYMTDPDIVHEISRGDFLDQC